MFAIAFVFVALKYAVVFAGGGYVGYRYGKSVYEKVENVAKKF